MNRKTLVRSAVAGLFLAGSALAAQAVAADESHKGMEMCAGIAKAGKNDCKSQTHACKGMSTRDRDPGSFVWVPKGTCEKIAGGHVMKPAM